MVNLPQALVTPLTLITCRELRCEEKRGERKDERAVHDRVILEMKSTNLNHVIDGYYVAYNPIALSCILFMFIEMKFIYCHSCVMFAMKSMSIYNDLVNYDEIII